MACIIYASALVHVLMYKHMSAINIHTSCKHTQAHTGRCTQQHDSGVRATSASKNIVPLPWIDCSAVAPSRRG